MYNELNEQIERAQQGIARLRKIDSMLGQLISERDLLERKKADFKAVLDKENYDVERIENTSIASVFYSILGNLDERIEKERREAIAAKLKYDQTAKDLEDIKFRVSELSAERLNYVECQKEYDLLYTRKKELLLQESGETAQRILKLTDSLNRARINLKEINEALSVGEQVLCSLNSAMDSLGKAEGWGTWDMLGGGLIADLAKHSNIDNAKEETEIAQQLLRRFRAELTDISISSDISIQTEGFAKFADFFFDGLIADWFMQSKIHESQESVWRVRDQVQNVIGKLNQMKTLENSNIAGLEAELGMIITKA